MGTVHQALRMILLPLPPVRQVYDGPRLLNLFQRLECLPYYRHLLRDVERLAQRVAEGPAKEYSPGRFYLLGQFPDD